MNSSEKFFKLLGELFQEKNGQVAETMLNLGVIYKVNYGVSLATIRAVAVKYGPDHELALQLFEHDSREAKIAATLVDDPAQVTPEQMDGWALEFLNGELVEQVCANLFRHVEYSLAKSFEWCLSEKPFLKKAGYLLAGYAAKNADYRNQQLLPYLEMAVSDASHSDVHLRTAIAFALREIALRNEECSKAVKTLLAKLSSNSDSSSAWIVEEVAGLIG
jgi:Predicted DNA alkylation repair enzyme